MANNEEPRRRALNDSDDDDDNESVEDDPLAHLPDYVLSRVEKLHELNETRDRHMKQYLAERAALEKKYEGLMKPLYKKRTTIVRGDLDKDIAKDVAKKKGEKPRASTADDVTGIPQFWACAMTQMETVGELITEDDVDCLEHLEDITCTDREDGKGFTLFFHFTPNEYFTNKVLKKEYEVPNLLLSDEPLLRNVSGTLIDWKSGRSLTHRIVKKKQRGKGKNAGQLRTVNKTEEKESFFHWFNPPEMPPMDTMDEEEAERLEELFDGDYEVAQAFRSDLIPKAVLWFSGRGGEEEEEELAAAS